jgi:hypothetical protein
VNLVLTPLFQILDKIMEMSRNLLQMLLPTTDKDCDPFFPCARRGAPDAGLHAGWRLQSGSCDA